MVTPIEVRRPDHLVAKFPITFKIVFQILHIKSKLVYQITQRFYLLQNRVLKLTNSNITAITCRTSEKIKKHEQLIF
jgi:hypothetical protein